MQLDSRVPTGPIEKAWDNYKFEMKLVNPANKRKYNIIVVGSGLAGGSAAATMAELGYNVKCFCFQDSPRRAHSIAAQGGINDALVELLQLKNAKPFGMSSQADSYRLTVYVPSDALDAVLDACSAAGAGVIGNYRRCAFYSSGTGTFEASSQATPHLGNAGERTTVEEMRVEMVCPGQLSSDVIKALRAAHPYEEPAFDLVPISGGKGQQLGRIGELTEPVSLSDFAASVDATLGTHSLTWGWADKPVARVAVEGGAADSDWQAAKAAGAYVMVTGEVKQHIALEAAESNFAIIAAGHYATEHPGCEALRQRMAQEVPDVGWFLFEPPPGMSGRPL